MSNSDENIKNVTKEEKVKNALEQEKIEKLNEETDLMNNLTDTLKSLEEAERRGEISAIECERRDLYRVLVCLGDSTRETLNDELKVVEQEIADNGATALNIATKKNIEAKLKIVDRREEIAARLYSKKEKDNKRSLVLLTGVAATIAGVVAVACAIKGCGKNDISSTTSTDTTSTITTTTEPSTEPTTIGTTTEESSKTTLETIDDDYTSPTLETTTTNTDKNGNGNNNGKKSSTKPGTKIKNIRNTSPNSKKVVVSKPTNNTPKPTKNTTGTYETDINGTTKPNGKKSTDKKPTGKDPLPKEPTKKTLSPEELAGMSANNDDVKVENIPVIVSVDGEDIISLEKNNGKVLAKRLTL